RLLFTKLRVYVRTVPAATGSVLARTLLLVSTLPIGVSVHSARSGPAGSQTGSVVGSWGGSASDGSRKFAARLSPRSPSAFTVTSYDTDVVLPTATGPLIALVGPSRPTVAVSPVLASIDSASRVASSITPARSSTWSTVAEAFPRFSKCSV